MAGRCAPSAKMRRSWLKLSDGGVVWAELVVVLAVKLQPETIFVLSGSKHGLVGLVDLREVSHSWCTR